MLNLNLLTPSGKTELRYALAIRFVVLCGTAVSVIGGIGLVLLLPALFFISFQRTDMIRALAIEQESQEQTGIAADIRRFGEANQIAAAALRETKRPRSHSATIEGVVRAAPDGVRFDSIELAPANGEVAVTGFAPTRIALLQFLDALRRDSRFGQVTSPVQNLIREANINFTVTLVVAAP